MANGKNRLFWLASLAISSIPLAVTFYGVYADRKWITILSFTLFLICLILSTCTFLSWKTVRFSTPIILQILRALSLALTPLAHVLRGIPVLGKVTNGSIRLIFWSWFIILMLSDVFVRKLLKAFVGLHEPSAGQYSLVNACDTNFQPCGEFGKVLDKEKVRRIEEGGHDFERDHDYDERKVSIKPRPNSTYKRSKERPKSMDYSSSKYKTSGKDGSDLSSMTSADWAKVLEMANIEKSRYGVLDGRGGGDQGRGQALDQSQSRSQAAGPDRPRYSQPIATTLAMVSKLVYEDVPIIRHELARSGYDLHSFRAIAYKNTCGFIVQKGRNIVLVFRGTDPLNLQHAWTDLQSRLAPIETSHDPPQPLGKCHQGMYNALGKSDNFLLPSEELAQQQRELSRRHRRHSNSLDWDDMEVDPQTHDISPASTFRSEVSKPGTLNLELSNQSIYQTLVTSIRAACLLIKFLVMGLFTHVSDPVDYRFAGEVRDLSAFAQSCRWVDGLRLEHAEREVKKMTKSGYYPHPGSLLMTRSNSLGSLYSQDEVEGLEEIDGPTPVAKRRPSISSNGSFRATTRRLSITHQSGQGHHRRRLSGNVSDSRDSFQQVGSWKNIGNTILDIYNNQHRNERDGNVKRKKLRFYICGHSLGGGLATIFLAKMVQCSSPLLDIFSGLYTYGCPRIGDKDFSHAFGSKLACKMFHHVHNNDVFARVPFWGAYETPPGTLVFIDSSRTLTLYPPDPVTLMPVPVRGISFMHLSGMLNVRVIMRMRKESWLRVLERIVLPFFLNDHFPGDYVKGLAEGKLEIVVQDTAHFGGVDETETGSPAQSGYFSFLSRGHKKTVAASRTPEEELALSKLHGKGSVDGKKRMSFLGGDNGRKVKAEPMSADNDSGYGPGNRSDDVDKTKVRRRIVKYTYPQDEVDDEENRHGEYSTRNSRIIPDSTYEREGSMRWRELSPEPSPGRPMLRRSRSSSLSWSNKSHSGMQKSLGRSISKQRRQSRGEISMLEINA